MHVTLIRPPILVPRLALTAPTCPPVGLAYVAGALRAAGHDVTVIDAVGAAPDQFVDYRGDRLLTHGLTVDQTAQRVPADTDVIGVSCMFSHEWPVDRELLEAVRRRCPEALLVVGGEHVTAMADVVLDQCPAIDVVVLGEGETTLAEVIARHAEGAAPEPLAGTATREVGDDSRTGTPVLLAARRDRVLAVDDLAAPAWDLFPVEAYLSRGLGFGVHRGRSMPVVATRGCPYQCTFCSSPAMWTTRYVARSPQEVVDEIQSYVRDYAAENIDFYDLTAIVRKSWVLEFCRLVQARGLSITWQLPSGTRSEALDDEVLGELYRAGCRNLSYAPESGSPAVLERIKKRVDLGRMRRSMRAAVRAGINTKANIILGFPGETHREVFQTLGFCVHVAVLGLHDLSITPFSPYPGTELFDELSAAGRVGPFDDEYFLSLLSYSDLSAAVSWSEHISDAALGRYRALGMALFYGTSFLCRPWRVLQLVRNVAFREQQESRLEMTLKDHLHRRKGR
ncbi:MAG: B12-binding domain-containing radical SAM protein [Microthrixaceae bacterium]